MENYWPSPAKINLFLHIIGRRKDGYHNLQTIFQLLDYGDALTFTPRSDQQINATFFYLLNPVSQPSILETDNLVLKAAKLLRQYTKNKTIPGMDIRIEKRIPIGGGLGGGSSNAATTLLALNYLWQINLSQEELLKLGLQLGADVPIFIKGRTSWAEGIGEKLKPIRLPETWYLVLIPPQTVSTSKLFSDPRLTYNTTAIRIQTFLHGYSKTVNDFERVVRQSYPVVAEALDFLNRFAHAHLSGTGSCIFAAFETETQAKLLQKKIESHYPSFISKGLKLSPLHEKLDALQTQ